MHQICKPLVGIVPLAAAAGIAMGAACEVERSGNPLSSHLAGPIPGVTITASEPLEPTQGVKIADDQQPVQLVFANASSNSVRPFWHIVDVAIDKAFVSIVHSSGNIQPAERRPCNLRVTPRTRS